MVTRRLFLRSAQGFTLLEVLLATVIFVGATVGLCATLVHCSRLVAFNQERVMAINAAQGILEAEINRGFAAVVDGRISDAQPVFVGPMAVPGAFAFPISAQIRVRDVDNEAAGVLVAELRVIVCWRSAGRIIGEDANFNGVVDAGEDLNGNGVFDGSPALVETRLATTAR
jgi:prepilin-type N-terminal cleavage/methylation domain-containing protein